MSSAVHESTAVGGWSLTVPPAWARLPLAPGRNRALASLIPPARTRETAVARGRLLLLITRLVADAREQGASAAYLCLDEVGGLPLPASLVVAETAPPGLADLDATHSAVIAELAAALGGQVQPLPAGPAALTTATTDSEFRAQAHVPVPGTPELLVLTLSTPLPQLAAAWERLFLAILGTLRWRMTAA